MWCKTRSTRSTLYSAPKKKPRSTCNGNGIGNTNQHAQNTQTTNVERWTTKEENAKRAKHNRIPAKNQLTIKILFGLFLLCVDGFSPFRLMAIYTGNLTSANEQICGAFDHAIGGSPTMQSIFRPQCERRTQNLKTNTPNSFHLLLLWLRFQLLIRLLFKLNVKCSRISD